LMQVVHSYFNEREGGRGSNPRLRKITAAGFGSSRIEPGQPIVLSNLNQRASDCSPDILEDESRD
jgi:hypothetical protein